MKLWGETFPLLEHIHPLCPTDERGFHSCIADWARKMHFAYNSVNNQSNTAMTVTNVINKPMEFIIGLSRKLRHAASKWQNQGFNLDLVFKDFIKWSAALCWNFELPRVVNNIFSRVYKSSDRENTHYRAVEPLRYSAMLQQSRQKSIC
nr:chemokine-like protein TAFA-1 isoform X1 [Pan troglodytes]